MGGSCGRLWNIFNGLFLCIKETSNLTEEKIDSCLKFSKNSWHYKLVLFIYGTRYFYHWGKHPKTISLCKYFWTVVTAILVFPILFSWRSLPDSITYHEDLCKAVIVWALICTVVHITSWSISGIWWIGLTIFFGGVGVALAIFGFIALMDKLWHNYQQHMRYKPDKPNLVKEFVKARKNKVCPCIEFVDDTEKEDNIKKGIEGLK